MRLSLQSSLSLGTLSTGRSLALAAMAILLAVADWLPANPYVDPDHLEFTLSAGLGLGAIALTLHDRLGATGIIRWRNRAILVAFAVLVSLVMADAAARIIFRDVTTTFDGGGYFTTRWLRSGDVRLNSGGFRERLYTAGKGPGVYRIAVVGDSFTYGNGIRQHERYSDLLQTRLPDHFEVLNFGTPGANTPQHLTLLQHLLPDIHPDFVLLQWYVNDVEDDDSTGRPAFRPLLPFDRVHDWLNDVSPLYTVANMKWAEAQVAMGAVPSYESYLHARFADPNSRDSQIDRGLLIELIELCKRAGVPIGIVLFPDGHPDLAKGYPLAYLHERVLDICRAENITCVDLRSDFAKVRDYRDLWVNRFDHHPSALANQIAAVRVFDTFAKQWAEPPK